MMASRMQSNGGGFCSINLSSGLLLPLLYLLMTSSSPVVVVTSSFLIPCRQNHHKLTHHPPQARKSSSLLLPPTTVVLLSAEKSNEDLSETESTAAVSAAAGTSKRSQRKAAERVKKQRQQQKVASSTSLHPEAILKRQQQRQQQHHGDNKRRHHNFAQRKDYLTEGSEDDPINDELDHHYRLLTTADSNNDNAITGHHHNYNHHQLHSQAVSKLDASTKPDEVVKAIKRAQNLHDVHDIVEIAHFLLEEVDQSFAYGYRGSLLSRLAVASLHLQNYNIAQRCIIERRTSHRSSMLPLESAAIIRGLIRCHHTKEAWEVLEDELSLPLDGWIPPPPLSNNDNNNRNNSDMDDDADGNLHLEEESTIRRLAARDKLMYRARSIASIASRHFYELEPTDGIRAVKKLKEMGNMVHEVGLTADMLGIPWDRLVKGAALCEKERRDGKWDKRCEEEDDCDTTTAASIVENPSKWPCNIVYTVLDAMVAFPSENRDVTFEALCNALVRRTVFVTGAVSMDGCPEADRGEVAFIGRSNVGKSSLVNMLTNRKSLAFTSKTPGKTQQFNYFAVNDKPDMERQIRYGDDVPGSKDRDSFYIVDLPGFGFAKAPQQQRQQWSNFMDEYLQGRKTLQAVFHLIDARHGPTDEDGKIMRKVGTILGQKQQAREHCPKYIIILTKADKNVKNAKSQSNPGKVSSKVMEKVIQKMIENRVGYAPIVLTSAETRLGRDEVWKYLRFAAERL